MNQWLNDCLQALPAPTVIRETTIYDTRKAVLAAKAQHTYEQNKRNPSQFRKKESNHLKPNEIAAILNHLFEFAVFRPMLSNNIDNSDVLALSVPNLASASEKGVWEKLHGTPITAGRYTNYEKFFHYLIYLVEPEAKTTKIKNTLRLIYISAPPAPTENNTFSIQNG